MINIINSINDFVDLIISDIISQQWLSSLIAWVNGLIKSLLSLWNDNTAYIDIDYSVISDVLKLILFIVLFSIIISLFKLILTAFRDLQDSLNPAWRSEWRRKARR